MLRIGTLSQLSGLTTVVLLLAGMLLFAGEYLSISSAQSLCPPPTFQYGFTYSSAIPLLVSGFSGLGGWVGLTVFVQDRVRWWRQRNAPYARPPFYNYQMLIVTIIAWIVWGALAFNIAESYSCATPSGVIVRNGIFNATRTLSWNDLQSIHAWCWISQQRNSPSYPGATLDLLFTNNEGVGFSLNDGSRVSMKVYEGFRAALRDKQYAYTADSTVTPDQCPAALYRPLRDWATE